MITESLGLMLLGPAVRLLREATLRASWESGAIRMPKSVAGTAAIARPANPVASPPAQAATPKKQAALVSSDSGYLDISILPTKPKSDDGDWLTIRPKPLDALGEQAKQPWTPASSFGGGGGALPGAGGFSNSPTSRGSIAPLRLSPPSANPNPPANSIGFAAPPSSINTSGSPSSAVSPSSEMGQTSLAAGGTAALSNPNPSGLKTTTTPSPQTSLAQDPSNTIRSARRRKRASIGD